MKSTILLVLICFIFSCVEKSKENTHAHKISDVKKVDTGGGDGSKALQRIGSKKTNSFDTMERQIRVGVPVWFADFVDNNGIAFHSQKPVCSVRFSYITDKIKDTTVKVMISYWGKKDDFIAAEITPDSVLHIYDNNKSVKILTSVLGKKLKIKNKDTLDVIEDLLDSFNTKFKAHKLIVKYKRIDIIGNHWLEWVDTTINKVDTLKIKSTGVIATTGRIGTISGSRIGYYPSHTLSRWWSSDSIPMNPNISQPLEYFKNHY